MRTIIWYSYSATLNSILATLLLRLYFTFKDSVLEITKAQKWMLIVSYLFGIISVCMEPCINFKGHGFILGVIIYFVLSIYGMVVFSKKMYQVAKMDKTDELLSTTIKYVSLLCIATLSSWIVFSFMILAHIITLGDDGVISITIQSVRRSMVGIDCVVNIICLYLQYPFNDEYYKKYCACITNCCMYLITRRNQNEINLDDIVNSRSRTTTIDIESGEATATMG